MGLYKLCKHKGRARDRCEDAWWGSFQHRGRLHRASLEKWANEEIRTKAQAEAVFDRMRDAIRHGTFSPEVSKEPEQGPLSFDRFAAIYVERYVQANKLASADTIEYRMAPLLQHFGRMPLAEIRTADVEDFVAKLKEPAVLASIHKVPRARRPATINRYLSLLRHMSNWAVGREYLDRTPFRRGNQALVRQELEDNRRHRRITPIEEKALLDAAPAHVQPLMVIALDAGLRRGEMLALTWADVDARPGWLRLRGETTKSGKTRWVPIATTRLSAVLDFLRLDADGQRKASSDPVCSNEAGESLKYFRSAWVMTVLRAHGISPAWKKRNRFRAFTPECLAEFRRIDLRWHDLRHEYASRLVERGVPLSQVRDLLGHASIVTTERYDNQSDAALFASAKLLDTGETFKILSRSRVERPADTRSEPAPKDAKFLDE
jgi:integrase